MEGSCYLSLSFIDIVIPDLDMILVVYDLLIRKCLMHIRVYQMIT